MKRTFCLLFISAIACKTSYAPNTGAKPHECYMFKVVNNVPKMQCKGLELEFPTSTPTTLKLWGDMNPQYYAAVGFDSFTRKGGRYYPADKTGKEITDYCNYTCADYR